MEKWSAFRRDIKWRSKMEETDGEMECFQEGNQMED